LFCQYLFWWTLQNISEHIYNVKLIRHHVCCTRCAFRLIKSPQWCLGRKSWKSGKNVKITKETIKAK
jgi:hypothetical protein